MAKIGRNQRCPCGSGAKFKRCCGTREAQAALERRASALEQLMVLPVLFPRLRPQGRAFGSWADRVAAEQLDAPPLDEGLAMLEPVERERIERGHAHEQPEVWRSLVDELASEQLAHEAVVRGAVAAGVWERRPADARGLALLEDSSGEDPANALALVLDPSDLWSAFESGVADAALAELDDDLDDEAYDLIWNATIAAQARRLRGAWHEARMAELVARVGSRLPFDHHPRASATLARACDEFERDRDVRERLAVSLLADSVCRLALRLVPALAA